MLAFTGGAVFGPATRVTEQADFAEPISRIRVDTPSGEVEVNAGGEIVHVERTLSYGDERPEVIEQVEDGVLTLSVRCQGGGFLIGGCGADYVITAPADVALEVDTGSGGIDVNGMTAGEVRHRLRWCRPRGCGRRGLGRHRLGERRRIRPGRHIDHCRHRIGRSRPRVRLGAGYGRGVHRVGGVEITVPEGTYAIAMDGSSGSETLEGVVNDPSAERTITIDTGSGGILVEAGG